MFPLFLLIAAIVLMLGLGIKIYLDTTKHEVHITGIEYLITSFVILAVVIPLTWVGGWKMAVSNKMTYNEYLNGWEQRADKQVVICTRDGPCRWSYSCDPYIVCHTVCSSNGKTTSCHEVCVTHWHECPYCDQEWNYGVQTSLGYYNLEWGRFPTNPVAHTWRAGESPSPSVIAEAGVGDPEFWTAIRMRLDSGLPGPVTKRHSYTNYIYASNYTILSQFAGDVDLYRKHELLPDPPSKVIDPYYANKVLFVKYVPVDMPAWERDLNYLNAGLGSAWQGDMTLLVVQSAGIAANYDKYAQAVKATWMSGELLGHDAASKNGIIVIIGTDGQKITWTKAFTTMPLGNKELVDRIETTLPGLPMNPDSIIGKAENVDQKQIQTSGALANIAVSSDVHFHRQPMAVFAYLKDEIEPTHGQKMSLFILAVIFASLCWLGPIYHPDYRDTFSRREYSYGQF